MVGISLVKREAELLAKLIACFPCTSGSLLDFLAQKDWVCDNFWEMPEKGMGVGLWQDYRNIVVLFAGCTVSNLRLKCGAIRNYLAIPFEHTKLARLTKVSFQQERDGELAVNPSLQSLLQYDVNGSLQVALQEYANVLAASRAELKQAIEDGFIGSDTLQIDTWETFFGQDRKRARCAPVLQQIILAQSERRNI